MKFSTKDFFGKCDQIRRKIFLLFVKYFVTNCSVGIIETQRTIYILLDVQISNTEVFTIPITWIQTYLIG